MLIIITAFVTFMLTTVGIYAYIKNDGNLFLVNKQEIGGITSELYTYKNIIDQYYLGEVDEEKLEEGAIRGYIEGLGDPYTEYISEEEMEDYMQDTLGNYVGIGVYMAKDKETNYVKIISFIENSPAEKAGLLVGDFIVGLDDKTYTADEMDELSDDIKGEEGTKVKLTILRGTDTKEFTVKREKIKVNPVEGKILEENIGYIAFTSFDETTAEDFKEKYDELRAEGMQYLIMDLRNNGGGLVDQALKIADYIAEKGSVLLYEVDKKGNEEIEKSKNDPIVNVPVCILTNKNTASASEILVGALQDLKKAKIVGTTTYGKGIIQEILSVKDSGGIKITTQEYQTPNHHKIHKVGIEPDEKVELPKDVGNVLTVPEEKDTQLNKAKEVVKKIET